MARQYIAAVLDSEGTLEERLNKVAPRAEHHDYEAESHPLQGGEGGFGGVAIVVPADQISYGKHDDGAAYGAFPALAR